MAETRIIGAGQWKYVFRDCDEEDFIVIEQHYPDKGIDGEPVRDVRLPRGAWVDLMLWLQEHK